MEKDLLKQLNLWHNDREYEKIADRILEIPEPDRDYDSVSHLARALNNLERYEAAVQLLLTMEKQGDKDPLWHYRLGYSYYHLKQYEAAIREFEIVNKLDPADKDALMFIEWSRQEIGQMKRKRKQLVQAESEQSNDIGIGKVPLAEKVKPFLLVEHNNGKSSVILAIGTYKDEVFQTRADEGFEGNGYDWGSLAAVFLEERMPQLMGIVHFDPEASMFCAYSDNREALQSFSIGFKDACEDDAVIRDLFSRAQLD
ncbi:immunity 51 family protein [Cohnella boryungensis]|uniref:Imm51 family immunity protein n=1 Tax=Cohnella boryungensis TaxID=768479 RepID=A0ABV8SD84_9BACL